MRLATAYGPSGGALKWEQFVHSLTPNEQDTLMIARRRQAHSANGCEGARCAKGFFYLLSELVLVRVELASLIRSVFIRLSSQKSLSQSARHATL